MESVKTQCVISGGGPAGIMLGYLLARAGIDVVVLEKWPDFFRDFRGDTIHPSTMEVLAELGLLDDFLKLPHNEMKTMALHIGSETATVADLSKLHTRCPFIAFIPQWDFLNFMAEKGKAYPHFHLMMATEATDLISEGARVTGLSAKNAEGSFAIHADLVIGADGRHSTVREKGEFAVAELGVPIDVLWFRVGRGEKDDQQSLGYVTQGGVLIMLDRREYWQCAFIIEKDGFNAVKAKGLDAFRKSVTALSGMPESALSEVDSWDKVKLLSVSVDHVKRWAKEGVLLIGDAAHAMSPVGGVGINYAIQDAVAAANILVPAFRKGDVSLPVLEKLQARREVPVRKMQKMQVFLHDHAIFPYLRKQGPIVLPIIARLFKWFPALRRLPAHMIGIGFLPEHVSSAVLGKV